MRNFSSNYVLPTFPNANDQSPPDLRLTVYCLLVSTGLGSVSSSHIFHLRKLWYFARSALSYFIATDL